MCVCVFESSWKHVVLNVAACHMTCMTDGQTDGYFFSDACVFLYLLSFISILMLALLRLLRATNNPLRSALTCCMRLDETTKALDRNTFGAKRKSPASLR